jgi:hypothetical protein
MLFLIALIVLLILFASVPSMSVNYSGRGRRSQAMPKVAIGGLSAVAVAWLIVTAVSVVFGARIMAAALRKCATYKMSLSVRTSGSSRPYGVDMAAYLLEQWGTMQGSRNVREAAKRWSSACSTTRQHRHGVVDNLVVFLSIFIDRLNIGG